MLELFTSKLFPKRPGAATLLRTGRRGFPATFLMIFLVLLLGGMIVGSNSTGFGANSLFAQDADGTEITPAPDNSGTSSNASAPEQLKRPSLFMYYLQALGLFFAPIFFILSVAAVAFIFVNFLGIRREVLMPMALIEQFGALLDEKDYQGAYELARDNDSFLGKILAAGLAKMSSGYEQASTAMQDVAEKETMILEHRLSIVALIGNISPMVGLLGTVVGMVASFQVLAYSTTPPTAQKLAEGIATALVTTEFGLIIAIPAIMVYDILRNKLSLLVLELSVMTESLMSKIPGVGK